MVTNMVMVINIIMMNYIFEARHIMGTWLPNLLALFVTNDNYIAASVYGYGAW